MVRAPAWLDCARKEASAPGLFRCAIRSSPEPPERKQALKTLERACALIIAAANGSQDDTRHRICFLIGVLIARGDLDYATACAALSAAARAMPAHGKPWRDLDKRVETSVLRGMGRSAR
jgi:hypothetical protein